MWTVCFSFTVISASVHSVVLCDDDDDDDAVSPCRNWSGVLMTHRSDDSWTKASSGLLVAHLLKTRGLLVWNTICVNANKKKTKKKERKRRAPPSGPARGLWLILCVLVWLVMHCFSQNVQIIKLDGIRPSSFSFWMCFWHTALHSRVVWWILFYKCIMEAKNKLYLPGASTSAVSQHQSLLTARPHRRRGAPTQAQTQKQTQRRWKPLVLQYVCWLRLIKTRCRAN